MENKKLIFGILAGFAAGAAMGVLFAPNKGSETRKNIARKREELKDELNSKLDTVDQLAALVLGKVPRRPRKAEPASETVNGSDS